MKPHIFIHIVRTGGSSIAKRLPTKRWGHFCIRNVHSQIQNVTLGNDKPLNAGADYFDKAFKFAIVRNPWDRAVSHFARAKAVHSAYMKSFTFETWIKNFDTIEKPFSDRKPWRVKDQAWYLLGKDGEIGVDYVGRFEDLEGSWKHICKKIGVPYQTLPVVRATKHSSYETYYTPELIDIVAKRYKRDIDLFGYKFGG